MLLVGRGHEALVVSSSLGLALYYPEPQYPFWVLLPAGCHITMLALRAARQPSLSATGAIPHAMSLLQPQAEKSGWDSWSSPVPTSFPKLPPSTNSPKISSLCSSILTSAVPGNTFHWVLNQPTGCSSFAATQVFLLFKLSDKPALVPLPAVMRTGRRMGPKALTVLHSDSLSPHREFW